MYVNLKIEPSAEAWAVIVSADYSQIELRIMAHISGDEGLLAALYAGEDVHRASASEAKLKEKNGV